MGRSLVVMQEVFKALALVVCCECAVLCCVRLCLCLNFIFLLYLFVSVFCYAYLFLFSHFAFWYICYALCMRACCLIVRCVCVLLDRAL